MCLLSRLQQRTCARDLPCFQEAIMLQQLRHITGNVAGKAHTARAIGCHLATAGGLGHMRCGGWCKLRERRAGRPAVQEHTWQQAGNGTGVAGIQNCQQRRRRRPPNE